MKYGYEYYIREVDLVGNNKVNEVSTYRGRSM